ncbi:hypothetical protein V2A60_009307 [Cordyceps javanica]
MFNWDTHGGDGFAPADAHLAAPPPDDAESRLSAHECGWMYPAIGNQWRIKYALSDMTWNSPRPLDCSCADAVTNGLEYEVGLLNVSGAPVPGDFCYWGGSMAAQARLALFADEMGRHDLVEKVVSYLKASFEHRCQPSSSTLPAYEMGWGGIINKAGYNSTWVDFGNGYYNDHHFHSGYFLNVAAVIARYDSTWLDQHRDYINFFVPSPLNNAFFHIVNPSHQDPYFPITRCRDWFAGHSWASGIANGAGSRDQESSGGRDRARLLQRRCCRRQWRSRGARPATPGCCWRRSSSPRAFVGTSTRGPTKDDRRDDAYPEPGMRRLVSMGNVM